MLGDGLDAAGVLRPPGREGIPVKVGLEPVAGRGEPPAERLDVSRGDFSVFRLQTDESGDFSDETQALVPQQPGGGPF